MKSKATYKQKDRRTAGKSITEKETHKDRQTEIINTKGIFIKTKTDIQR